MERPWPENMKFSLQVIERYTTSFTLEANSHAHATEQAENMAIERTFPSGYVETCTRCIAVLPSGETPQATAPRESWTPVDALVAQAAAVDRFQDTGEAVHAVEAARLSKYSGFEIGPHGELLPIAASSD